MITQLFCHRFQNDFCPHVPFSNRIHHLLVDSVNATFRKLSRKSTRRLRDPALHSVSVTWAVFAVHTLPIRKESCLFKKLHFGECFRRVVFSMPLSSFTSGGSPISAKKLRILTNTHKYGGALKLNDIKWFSSLSAFSRALHLFVQTFPRFVRLTHIFARFTLVRTLFPALYTCLCKLSRSVHWFAHIYLCFELARLLIISYGFPQKEPTTNVSTYGPRFLSFTARL